VTGPGVTGIIHRDALACEENLSAVNYVEILSDQTGPNEFAMDNVLLHTGDAISVRVHDDSGHGLDAVFDGHPSFEPACIGNGLSVAGLNNHGRALASDDQMTQTLTVEGYVNWSGEPGSGGSYDSYIIDKFTQEEGDAGRSWILGITRATNRLFARICYNQTYGHIQVDDPDPLPTNQCVGVAFTVGDGHLRLYVNGVLKSEMAFTGSINYQSNTYIGFANGHNLTEGWIGVLDEFRISNEVRTSFPAIPQSLEADEHTIALWRFDRTGSDH
jgi:hypothetical protein